MGTPYLHSGESIVLTTSRVSVDTVAYDIMLTTERLFLIDNRNARFEPRDILLSSILSVQGGKTPASDPVITLLFRTDDSGTARPPVNLIFTQDPTEKRKNERDEWVRSLIQLSISQREHQRVPEATVLPEEAGGPGLRPATRRGLAPERVRPLSKIADRDAAPAPVTVIPEEVSREGAIPATVAAAMVPRDGRGEPHGPPSAGTHASSPAPHTRIIMPQIIEEMLPERKTPAHKETEMPAPFAPYDPEVLFRTVPASGRPVTVTEERTVPSSPPQEKAGEDGPDLPGTREFSEREIPDIIRALQIGPPPPEPADTPAGPAPESSPEPAHDEYEDLPETIPELPQAPLIPPMDMQEPEEPKAPETGNVQDSPVPPAPEPAAGQEPGAAGPAPVRHPLPPAREIRPLRTTLITAAAVLVIIAIVAAGAVLFLQGTGQESPAPAPVPTTITTAVPSMVPVTTAPPVPSLPATTVPVTTVPAATLPPTTKEPAGPSSPIPADGVWVRISCTSEYFGTLGNAGFMRTVSGKGDSLYKILWNDKPVQVSVQKNDNSGSVLTATVYRNGTAIETRSVTSPMGSVSILIDPVTARAPGLSGDEAIFLNTSTHAVLENY